MNTFIDWLATYWVVAFRRINLIFLRISFNKTEGAKNRSAF
jgi:hypothetical protein